MSVKPLSRPFIFHFTNKIILKEQRVTMYSEQGKTGISLLEGEGDPEVQSIQMKSRGPSLYLAKSQLEEVKEVFNLFDKDGTGRMDIKHLKVALRALGFDQKKDDISRILFDLDVPNTTFLSEEQFAKILSMKLKEDTKRSEVIRAFQLFDDDNTGKITFKNLKRVAQELGEDLEDEEIQEMLDEADLDGDGEIDEKEFAQVIRKTNLLQ